MPGVAFELVPADRPGRGRLASLLRYIASACNGLFGTVTLILLLAVAAALPLVQFMTLGYLLEASARVGRSGRWRDALFGVRQATRIGGVIVGCAAPLVVLHLISSLHISAELIDPGGRVARNWHTALVVLSSFTALHLALACARGGRLRHFFWPFAGPFWLIRRLRQGGLYRELRDGLWDFVVALRLPYLFWLGVRGFAAAFCWLVIPITLIAAGRQAPALGFLGGGLLAIVILYVPFLQVHFAVHRRFTVAFDIRGVRRLFGKAPWAFAISLLVTLAFALPLYLLKIEMIPREAAWLPGVVFIVFIFPARVLAGWSYGRACCRDTPRHGFFRWTGRLAMLATSLVYVVVIYFTQFITWGGIQSLYEQHAFLLPVPFLP